MACKKQSMLLLRVLSPDFSCTIIAKEVIGIFLPRRNDCVCDPFP